MTRLEALQDQERAAEILCDIVYETVWRAEVATKKGLYLCTSCPAQEWCREGHNGFIDWLKEEDKR